MTQLAHALPLCWLVSLATLACEDDKSPQGREAPPARFEAVTKKAGVTPEQLAGFCDIQPQSRFKLPKISGMKEPGGAHWVNLWATWCKSCVEEMPMIERWREEYGFAVLYVSADEEPEALTQFQASHPELPQTAKMVAPEELSAWMAKLGLDGGAGLPLHVFVTAEGRVACARAAAVSEHHLPIVRTILK